MRRTVQIELNRVEGDLAIEVDLEGDVVADARCIGTLYRGFEQIMIGRAAIDATVITPRICGICSTAHLYAANLALEHAWRLEVPPLATLLRDFGHMIEILQSDLRQTFLFFTPDFVNPRYAHHPLQEKIGAAFAPFAGRLHRETLAATRKLLEIIALFGGQWPHSSWMVPGGVVSRPAAADMVAALAIIDATRKWFEAEALGGSLDDWLALADADALFAWDEAHADAGASLLSSFARDIGLQRAGIGAGEYLSYGARFAAEAGRPAGTLARAGEAVVPLDRDAITEDVSRAWYLGPAGGQPPGAGETVPNHPGHGDRYSWVKAPRYHGRVMQTGALAELLIAGDPLLGALERAEGGNAWLRQFARLRRAGLLLAELAAQARRILAAANQPHLNRVPMTHADGDGCGLLQTTRGALGHWVGIRDGKIARYQIIAPTTWNASPRDAAGRPGHWEATLIGTRLRDPDDPVEIGHIVRSHDPCLVCAVHMTATGRRLRIAD